MNLVSSLQELLPLNPMYTDEMRQYLLRFDQNDPSLLADCAASVTTTSAKNLQDILDTIDLLERLKKAQAIIKKSLKQLNSKMRLRVLLTISFLKDRKNMS